MREQRVGLEHHGQVALRGRQACDVATGNENAPDIRLLQSAMRRNVVDLPQPDGPSKATNSAARVAKFTLSTARMPLQLLTSPATSMTDTPFLPFPRLQAKTTCV